MSEIRHYIGFDCGNSSIRTVLSSFDGSQITTEVIHQVPNRSIRAHRYEFWDVLNIFYQMQKGFKLALDRAPDARSFGISTWGIDFGLIGASNELLTNPLCYRNPLGRIGMDTLDAEHQRRMFFSTGIQNHPMNSVYQLLGIRQELPEFLAAASHLLLVPDLLNYLFTGQMNSETSIASTMQLLDMRSQTYCEPLFEELSLDRELFSPLVAHRTIRGTLREDIAQLLGTECLPAICVPSHDTASAVVAVPTVEEDFVFISSGTWSLIGTELQQPIIDREVFERGFANEGGALGTITLLKNSAGMHILENIKREMEFSDSRAYSWDELIGMSRSSLEDPSLEIFDPNDEQLYNPDSMIGTLRSITGISDTGRILASAYASLAESYASTIADLEQITGKSYPVIHMIGGGARNDHLNQMTADRAGKQVIAGPVEATSLGTAALQILHDHPQMSVSDIRTIIRDSSELLSYSPA
jgi:rhamnulokinase